MNVCHYNFETDVVQLENGLSFITSSINRPKVQHNFFIAESSFFVPMHPGLFIEDVIKDKPFSSCTTSVSKL
jgi:hypothetical protein